MNFHKMTEEMREGYLIQATGICVWAICNICKAEIQKNLSLRSVVSDHQCWNMYIVLFQQTITQGMLKIAILSRRKEKWTWVLLKENNHPFQLATTHYSDVYRCTADHDILGPRSAGRWSMSRSAKHQSGKWAVGEVGWLVFWHPTQRN